MKKLFVDTMLNLKEQDCALLTISFIPMSPTPTELDRSMGVWHPKPDQACMAEAWPSLKVHKCSQTH